jgi:CubicO group peptidase (beta-lactamase class C family)
MRKIYIILLTISALHLPAFCQPTFVKDSLDNYMKRIMQDWKIPGMAVCIVKDGKVIVMNGYGVRNLETGDPVDVNTLFMIASNSKAFTGTALAMLEQEKRISLDDKLTKYFPWFRLDDPLATGNVTIRDAITHRLGFETFQGDFLNWGSTITRRQVMEKMAKHQPVFPFRYKYGYCNSGFVAAGEVIPAVTDTSWDDFLKYRIFNPLGMTRTSTTYAAIRKDQNASKPYTIVNDKLVLLDYANVDNLGAAASINSSVNDLSKWMLMLLDSGRVEGKRIVPFSAIQQTRTPQMIVNQVNRSAPMNFSLYGLGWFLEDYNGKKLVRHDGGANGFVTSVCLVPSENLGIAILTNTDANWMYTGLRYQLLQAYLGVPYSDVNAQYLPRYLEGNKKSNEEVKSWYDQAAAYAEKNKSISLKPFEGTYHNEVYDEISMKVKEGVLMVSFPHHPFLTAELTPITDTEFVCRYSDPTYGIVKIPFKISGSKVLSCTVTVADFVDMMPYEFTRVK